MDLYEATGDALDAVVAQREEAKIWAIRMMVERDEWENTADNVAAQYDNEHQRVKELQVEIDTWQDNWPDKLGWAKRMYLGMRDERDALQEELEKSTHRVSNYRGGWQHCNRGWEQAEQDNKVLQEELGGTNNG